MSSERRRAWPLAFLLIVAGAALHAQQPAASLLGGVARELACAPASPLVRPTTSIKVVGGNQLRKTLFGTGDAVIVSGGTAQGVRKGDEFFVRRVVNDRFTEMSPGVFPISIHTAGAVQIVDSQTDMSIAIITYGCDAVSEGDFLERFEPGSVPAGLIGTTPDFTRPGRLMLGGERRQTAAPGQFMVLDRGSDHGVRPGQLLTIFRTTVGGAGPVATIGTATVYVVNPETSIVRIERSIDAVYVGDLVAIHR